jgi:hypothetical protein
VTNTAPPTKSGPAPLSPRQAAIRAWTIVIGLLVVFVVGGWLLLSFLP